MTKNKKAVSTGIALGAALLFANTGFAASEQPIKLTDSSNVHCYNVHNCKGKSDCAVSGSHACKGLNECKGKGFVSLSAADCEEKGGSTSPDGTSS